MTFGHGQPLGELPDAEARARAERTFDRNIVVLAGAGTGKTTLLANRLVHLLMREPGPVAITELVALTFTNKAATEMKVRLRERLLALQSPSKAGPDPGSVAPEDLRTCYGISRQEIADRAGRALGDLEKAQIGTLHSFAAHLLRLHPIEAGVDPEFKEDDGLRFEELFSSYWARWLEAELGAKGRDHVRWRGLLSRVGLDDLRELARALCSELVPLGNLMAQTEQDELCPAMRTWLTDQRDRTRALLEAHDRPKRRRAESSLAAAQALFDAVLAGGTSEMVALGKEVHETLSRELGEAPKGWSDEEFGDCRRLVRIAKRLFSVERKGLTDILAVLHPFVAAVRAAFVRQGWMSFDGLLARARTLLAEHPTVRERLKRTYRVILVDEFQDTDPSQYEIILYLGERLGGSEHAWEDVELAPGKLFIVGDPKQSIYAFRRADIEAFERVVNKITLSGGAVYELVTNFRSHEAVLQVVNACFDRLFQPQPHVQPANAPLRVRPGRPPGALEAGVTVRLVRSQEPGEDFQSEAASRVEAERLARWLKEQLQQHPTLHPGHVALLFRKLTQAQEYLDALRRHGLPYITDGEKHFYRRQEVVDLINVLRVVDNPHDDAALVGLLRSPLGGVTDRELYELREQDFLNCRVGARLTEWNSARVGTIRVLYERLLALHHDAAVLPLPDVIDLVFARLPIRELAAASLHGEQAVANLMKVRQLADELADRPHLSLTGFVEVMIQHLEDHPDESEGALAEESLGAVRVMTIHKAKGLEFPVVILPGLHHGAPGCSPGRESPRILYDWATGVLGLTIGEWCSLGAIMAAEKARIREEAELYRLLYVGMTRAKDRLILSGGVSARQSRGTFLSFLADAAGASLGVPEESQLAIGPALIHQEVIPGTDRTPRRPGEWLRGLQAAPDGRTFMHRWRQREAIWTEVASTPVHLTPSLLRETEELSRSAGHPTRDPDRLTGTRRQSDQARLIGTLVHRVLERWNYRADREELRTRVEQVCRAELASTQSSSMPTTDEALLEEVCTILMTFAESPAYADLRRATILGREVPFSIPWQRPTTSDGRSSCVMEGAIDVLYRLDGQLWVADYKTDRVHRADVPAAAEAYYGQAEAYRRAVSTCLASEPVKLCLIFLRPGVTVEL